MVIDAGGGDVRVPQRCLHLGDVRLAVERVGRRRRPKRMRADIEPDRRR